MSYEPDEDAEMLLELPVTPSVPKANGHRMSVVTLVGMCILGLVFMFFHPTKSLQMQNAKYRSALFEEQDLAIRFAFNQFDLDRNGTIEEDEVMSYITNHMNVSQGSDDFQELLNSLTSLYGNLTFADFVSKYGHSSDSSAASDQVSEAYRPAFNVWDNDNDGFISEADIAAWLAKSNVTATTDGFDNILKLYMDEYGNMNFEQFTAKQLATAATNQAKEVYRPAFNEWDIDNDGIISEADVATWLAGRNITVLTEGYGNYLQLYMGHYGNLDFDQFVTKSLAEEAADRAKEVYRPAFDTWDSDSDGVISQADVEHFLANNNITNATDGFENYVNVYMDQVGNLDFNQYVAKIFPPSNETSQSN